MNATTQSPSKTPFDTTPLLLHLQNVVNSTLEKGLNDLLHDIVTKYALYEETHYSVMNIPAVKRQMEADKTDFSNRNLISQQMQIIYGLRQEVARLTEEVNAIKQSKKLTENIHINILENKSPVIDLTGEEKVYEKLIKIEPTKATTGLLQQVLQSASVEEDSSLEEESDQEEVDEVEESDQEEVEKEDTSLEEETVIAVIVVQTKQEVASLEEEEEVASEADASLEEEEEVASLEAEEEVASLEEEEVASLEAEEEDTSLEAEEEDTSEADASEAEEADASEAEEADASEAEEEELFEIEIAGKNYYTDNEENGTLYAILADEEAGDKVGVLVKGKAKFIQ